MSTFHKTAWRSNPMLTAAALRHFDEGTSVILDASFQQREQWDVFMDGIKGRPLYPCRLCLTADAEQPFARAGARRDDASDADVEARRLTSPDT